MKTICFKLITGEEIIAKIDSEDDQYLNVSDPVKLSYEYDLYTGEYGLKFLNFMPYNDEMLFTFDRKYIITYIQPSDKMLKYYMKYLLALAESEIGFNLNHLVPGTLQ
jgi:hypothetical protein